MRILNRLPPIVARDCSARSSKRPRFNIITTFTTNSCGICSRTNFKNEKRANAPGGSWGVFLCDADACRVTNPRSASHYNACRRVHVEIAQGGPYSDLAWPVGRGHGLPQLWAECR